ncbi:unnamed protein product [Adineta steineri]|uniref:Uncharacterized protein n=1 Tax=Adineta steineri TaxID=433720 RepID=A0A814NLD7_9BILA|nr:unnamed protein product [Adineta steineri]
MYLTLEKIVTMAGKLPGYIINTLSQSASHMRLPFRNNTSPDLQNIIIFCEEYVSRWKCIRSILGGHCIKPIIIIDSFNYLNIIYGSPSKYLHGYGLAKINATLDDLAQLSRPSPKLKAIDIKFGIPISYPDSDLKNFKSNSLEIYSSQSDSSCC